MSDAELKQELDELRKEYKKVQAMDMQLNMSRGIPCIDQLDLSMGMMDVLDSSSDLTCEDGTDCRNYGQLTGIEEARELLGDMMENNPKDIIIYGNSSLNVMFDTISPRLDTWRHGQHTLVQAARGEIPLSRPGVRPTFCHHRILRHQNGSGSHDSYRPGYGHRGKTGQRR